jgi:Ca2+-binding EF-hand superfamily protein
VSVNGVATDFKPGDFVKSRRTVITQECVHKVGDKVMGWRNYVPGKRFLPWSAAVVATVNGDGTCTLKWDDGDTEDTVKKSTGEIRGPNMAVTVTRTLDKTLYSALVKAKLSDVFKEADVNHDGKLTYDEWESRLGKLVPGDELQRLFHECDTDKNGSLDRKEFETGMAGKYEIQWAQVLS